MPKAGLVARDHSGAVDRGSGRSRVHFPKGIIARVGGRSENMKGKGWSWLQLREPQRRTLGKEDKREDVSCTRLTWSSSWRELSHQ